MKIKIKCPACAGKGKFKALDCKCNYCNGHKKVLLTQYLYTLGKKQELRNVQAFQIRTEDKPKLVNAAA